MGPASNGGAEKRERKNRQDCERSCRCADRSAARKTKVGTTHVGNSVNIGGELLHKGADLRMFMCTHTHTKTNMC